MLQEGLVILRKRKVSEVAISCNEVAISCNIEMITREVAFWIRIMTSRRRIDLPITLSQPARYGWAFFLRRL